VTRDRETTEGSETCRLIAVLISALKLRSWRAADSSSARRSVVGTKNETCDVL
jgi:hypothetical protein